MNKSAVKKNDPATIRAWAMFDWANSVYQLSITSALLPAYFAAITTGLGRNYVQLFGREIVATALYAFVIAASFLTVALLSPILSSIADYTGRRKLFMQIFTYLGAGGVIGMYFLTPDNIGWGMLCFYLGSTGYAGSLVFYNSFLPLLADEDKLDRISARGFSMGYIGSVILLIINLLVLFNFQYLGLESKGMAIRLCFIMVGIWWLLFSAITFRCLPKYAFGRKTVKAPLWNGFVELSKVWQEFRRHPQLKIYLISFFFNMMGVLTVMYMAANFGKKELNISDEVLIPTVLVIQLIAIGGAYFCAWLSGRFGNFIVLFTLMWLWAGICLLAYLVRSEAQFIALALGVGLVMGAAQSLARSTYARMLPSTQDHTSYFSFYDVMERLSIVLGTLLFGLLEQVTGNMRNSIALITICFVISALFLWPLIRKPQAKWAVG